MILLELFWNFLVIGAVSFGCLLYTSDAADD